MIESLTMQPVSTRRHILLAGGAFMMGAIAGCSGDDSIEEIESGIEETEGHLQAVDGKLEAAAQAIDNQDWQGCFSEADGLRRDVAAARESSNDALSLAEEEGHSNHVRVLERMQEYADIVEEMAAELDAACEAGQNGNSQQLEQHWAALQQLDDDRQAKREEINTALEELR